MKKNNFKRIVAIIAITAMALSISSCKKEEKLEIGEFSDLPITVWSTQGTDFVIGNKIEGNVVAQYIYDKTKVTVENGIGNDGGQWDTKLSRLIMGDNLPEVITCGAGQGPAHFKKLADVDKVWEITDELLEKYAPNVKKRIPEEILDKFKVDGKLYGIPYDLQPSKETLPDASEDTVTYINTYVNNKTSDETMGIIIRDDVLKSIYPEAKTWAEIEAIADGGPLADQLFDVPIKTTEEYIDFMYKLQNTDVKSTNGKAVYPFGYSGGDNWEALVWLGGDMMGYATHYYSSSWNPVENKIRLPLVEPLIKEGAKIQNKMIMDKVIDPESLVHTNAIYKEKVLNGQYVMCCADTAGGLDSINTSLKERGASFRYRPFYVQIPNKPEYAAGRQVTYWIGAIAFTKTLNENQFIQMLNWMNVCFSDEFDEVYHWGRPEDGLYVENEDGTRTFKDDRFNKRFLEGDLSALDNEETMGLGTSTGEVYVRCVAPAYNAYAPAIYNRQYKLTTPNAVKKYTPDSPHMDIPDYPSYNVWDAKFANIPEVVEFWSKRQTWENAFSLALAAKSESEFETKWQGAIDTLNSIANVEEMCKKMTEATLASK